MYVHRCGRTARIGKSGESLALLGPEDEKNFRMACKVLGKDSTKIGMLEVSYTKLNKLEEMVKTAKEVEAAMHKKDKEEKSAYHLMKIAKNADLDLDD